MPAALPTLGKYQLLERLGRGGAAEVFQAFNPVLERTVAIKLLHAHLSEAPDFTSRFLREARLVAQLRHPHIVQVFDFDVDGERPYMVMEFLSGSSLKDRLDEYYRREEHLPLPDVLRLFRDLLDAVGYAHAQGMVHRDLKPANILLDSAGRPVLTDFGIARLLGADRLTATGIAIGTPAYMSPEQGQGGLADERSDLYALGIVLYECLTGSVPFDADTAVAVLLKHIHQPVPPVREVRPDLPAALEQVVLKALAKNPADRYQTAAEMWQALSSVPTEAAPPQESATRSTSTEAASSQPVAAPIAFQRLRQRYSRWLLILVLVIALLSAGYALARRAAAPTAEARAVATADAWLAGGNAQLAADAYSAILEGNPTALAPRLGRARAYEQLGLVEDALADLNLALEVAPVDATLYAARARLNAQYGLADPAAVLADLDRALELSPPADSASHHFLRGWAILNFPLIGGQPNPVQALPNLQAAASLAPDNADYHFTLARALLAAERAGEALPAANRAVELAPGLAVHYKLRAHIQFVLGDLYAALDDLTFAIETEASTESSATLVAERGFLQHRLERRNEALSDLAEAERLAANAPLVRALAHLLAPSPLTPPPDDLTGLASLASDDPIWMALFQELMAANRPH